jgi:hypothetical protein
MVSVVHQDHETEEAAELRHNDPRPCRPSASRASPGEPETAAPRTAPGPPPTTSCRPVARPLPANPSPHAAPSLPTHLPPTADVHAPTSTEPLAHLPTRLRTCLPSLRSGFLARRGTSSPVREITPKRRPIR